MSTTIEQPEQAAAVATLPAFAVPTADRAISLVNGWLLREVGTATHVSQATFNAVTYNWHLPVLLAYPDTGPIGVIGDVYVHALSGQFTGSPTAEELERRAIEMAEAHGLIEPDEEE